MVLVALKLHRGLLAAGALLLTSAGGRDDEHRLALPQQGRDLVVKSDVVRRVRHSGVRRHHVRGCAIPDPPTIEAIATVMRRAGDGVHGRRLRALIAVLWRAGLRICQALALAEADLDAHRGSTGTRTAARCWCGAARAAAAARSVWTTGRGSSSEMAREGVPLIVIQRHLGRTTLGITSGYLHRRSRATAAAISPNGRRGPIVRGAARGPRPRCGCPASACWPPEIDSRSGSNVAA